MMNIPFNGEAPETIVSMNAADPAFRLKLSGNFKNFGSKVASSRAKKIQKFRLVTLEFPTRKINQDY